MPTMENNESRALPDSLLAALIGVDKGLALLRRQGAGHALTWANPAFFRIVGLEARSAVGRDSQSFVGALGSAKVELEEAIEQGRAWTGWSDGAGGKLRLRLDALPGSALSLWVEQQDDGLQERMDEALRRVEEVSGVDEKTGFSGPKAFWRSVGSLWAVCARNQLPVSLAMVAVRPHMKEKPGADYEEAAKLAFDKTFRRTSDIVGRLGQNSFAVFIVGHDARNSRERMEMFARELGEGYMASIGLAFGMPAPGSSSHAVKALSKRMLDKAFESKSSTVEFGELGAADA